MTTSTIATLSALFLLMAVAAPAKGHPPTPNESNAPSEANKTPSGMKETRIKILIGEKIFIATLADNPTASAFKALFPLEFEMSDLHGNEKFFHLPSRLPSHDATSGTIQAGDLMLWDSKSVVLFYKTFPTSYSYTKLGSIDNPDGLSAVVGSGGVTVKIDLERTY